MMRPRGIHSIIRRIIDLNKVQFFYQIKKPITINHFVQRKIQLIHGVYQWCSKDITAVYTFLIFFFNRRRMKIILNNRVL
jgi:hypothetical protein